MKSLNRKIRLRNLKYIINSTLKIFNFSTIHLMRLFSNIFVDRTGIMILILLQVKSISGLLYYKRRFRRIKKKQKQKQTDIAVYNV